MEGWNVAYRVTKCDIGKILMGHCFIGGLETLGSDFLVRLNKHICVSLSYISTRSNSDSGYFNRSSTSNPH